MAVVEESFYRCKCFLTDNIFLSKIRRHINFYSKDQFLKDYSQVLDNATDGQADDLSEELLADIEKEIRRRKTIDSSFIDRRVKIAASYKPLHPHLYTLQDYYFDPEFLKIVSRCRDQNTKLEDIKKIIDDVHPGQQVYSFPVFTPTVCQQLLEEIIHFQQSDLPKGRPNTMHNYGVLLSEIGFDEGFLNPLREKYLNPLTSILYPDWGGGTLDSHRAFVVFYGEDGDEDLAYHYDNAEITLNLCLGKVFKGGDLYFGNMWNDPKAIEPGSYKRCSHLPTRALLHRGRHRHGALPVDDGERYNLIIWLRSSSIRNALCPMCHRKPDLIKSGGYGDGFTSPTVNVCSTS